MKYLSKLSPDSIGIPFRGTVAFLIILIACCCNKEPSTTKLIRSDLATPRNDIIGLPNFAKISETLYRGAQPTKEGFVELKKMGVKTIINLRANHSDRELIKGLKLQYVEIPFNAGDTDEKNVIKFLNVVTNPNAGIMFVHCQHGSDRSGMMIAVYRMFVQGWTADESMEELPRFGFHEIYQGIRQYLKEFDVRSIRQKVASSPMPELQIIQ